MNNELAARRFLVQWETMNQLGVALVPTTYIMSILETAVHYLDSKRLQKLTEFISSSSPSFGSPLRSRNPPISSRQKLMRP